MAMAAARAERRLAAILAADVVGYSALMERDEDRTLARIKAHRQEFIEPLIAECQGRIVKLMGDGALVEFASVVDAVRCAVRIQQGMAEREAEVPEDERIRLRIGVNLGDVIHEADGDLYGDGVNIAARLEQLAEPGGVVVSGTAYDHLKGKLDLAVEAKGKRRLKNIAEPVRVYGVRTGAPAAPRRLRSSARRRWRLAAAGALLAVLVAVAVWSFWPHRPGLVAQPSVAVLPFANLGGDEATGRLADGITEDIITDLSRYRELDVIAQNSTAAYKDRPIDVREIGRALDVRYVLEGSIQRQGDQVRVTAQLIDATTGTHVWSERWDRPAVDVFAVQTEIAEQAVSRIGGGGAIPEAESRAARRARPTNLSAYELYLLGQQENDRQTKASVANAIRLLQQAVEKDPGLARVWVVLAWAYGSAANRGIDPEANSRAALAAAQRAVELDPMDPDAHAALANILGHNGNFPRAKAELETALRLNPGDAETLSHYAGWASTFGEPERGAEAADRALRLNPSAPGWAHGFFGYAYFMAGRYDDAARSIEHRPLESMTRIGLVLRAAVYAATGREDDAHRAVADTLVRYPDLTIESIVSDPGWNDVERGKLLQAMRQAGFPACASADVLAKMAKPVHLPECARP
jgi:TolB-like protein/class 3 adenylate cyclase/cytochrome c-type biogenesis protein CcmH/NrfG